MIEFGAHPVNHICGERRAELRQIGHKKGLHQPSAIAIWRGLQLDACDHQTDELRPIFERSPQALAAIVRAPHPQEDSGLRPANVRPDVRTQLEEFDHHRRLANLYALAVRPYRSGAVRLRQLFRTIAIKLKESTDMNLDDLHADALELMRNVLAWASPLRNGTGIDLGAGAGRKSAWLSASLGGGPVIALDLDAAALRQADPALWRICADGHRLPLRDRSIDRCYAIAALHLFTDPAAAIAEVSRVLRSGGDLCVLSASQRWACLRPELATHAAALAPHQLPPPADDLGAEWAAWFPSTTWDLAAHHAFLLGHSPDPQQAALPLADPVALGLPPADPFDADPDIVDLLLFARAIKR